MGGPTVVDLQDAGYARSWTLDDIHILRAADGHGDGRTVEAYAAVFESPTEIRDAHGHYMEEIARTAFKKTLAEGIDRVKVYYHHGMTIHGTPSGGESSVPIGTPLDIRADGRGLRTVTRYNRSALSDAVLEAIRDEQIRGYSFLGRIFKSNPSRVPRISRGSQLPRIVRTELGLSEYGPTPTPAYASAGIIAMRTALDEFGDRLIDRIGRMSLSTPGEPDEEETTSDLEAGAVEPRVEHSDRLQLLRFRRAVRERGI
jgi:HK97 family phage prohead protease